MAVAGPVAGPRRWIQHLSAGATFALFVGALYFALLFTNRTLASGDILLYFYPYRAYVAAALAEGQIPFWNPYLFAGAPLLANPQAAVLYPLHWPLIWLPVTQQVYWSAALHTWLLALGGYALMRRWDYGMAAALLTGLILAGSGFVGGLMGHINQLNGAVWLPWAVLCVEGARGDTHGAGALAATAQAIREEWPRRVVGCVGLGLVVALMLLAGHTQTVYINLFGLGIWTIWPALTWAAGWLRRCLRRTSPFTIPPTELLPRLVIYTAGILLGLLLSAPQLLPTLELSGLGLRSGGLNYLAATSFSLKPWQLFWTLLPTYGLRDLAALFDTPGYTEYVAYVGIAGLLLAAVGAWHGRGRAHPFGLLLAALGLFLALGRWNPVYYLLHQLAPGFDLFRAPARWMMLYTMGMAVLVGIGGAWVVAWLKRTKALVAAGLAALVALELLLAAQSLPHAQPTAPQAVYDVRTAPVHLLTDPARPAIDPAAAGRFLGLSTITYDPGDMADTRRVFLESEPPQLTERTFGDLIIAQKVQELLVPNLPLLWRVPTVDGFDGGVLPLERYNQFFSLLVAPEQLVPDGRLREQLRRVPPTDWLTAMHVQYLVADKVADLWFEDVYYDRQIGARLGAGNPQVHIDVPRPFAATHLDLIAYVDGEQRELDALTTGILPVAEVTVEQGNGQTERMVITAGGGPGAQLASGALDDPMAAAGGAAVAYQDIDGGRQEYRVRLPLAAPAAPTAITIRSLDDACDVVVQAATLYDARTGMFAALLPSDRGRFARVHSGDVKIYENLDVRSRAYLVSNVIPAGSAGEAASILQQGIDWPTTAVVEGGQPLSRTVQPGDSAEVVSYAPERVGVRTVSAAPAALVLKDAYYPGWHATVDGIPAPIRPANLLFRSVEVPAGTHTVVFTFAPSGWLAGLWLAAAGLLLSAAALCAAGWHQLRRRSRAGV